MNVGTCARCGFVGPIDWHHLLECDETGSYVDPILVIPLCRTCHIEAGIMLRALGLEQLAPSTPERILACVAAHHQWLAWPGHPVTLDAFVHERLAIALEAPLLFIRSLRTQEARNG
jgi:hypothetical protein